MTGRLLIAATPIGNALDASEHLRQALVSAPVIAAEDTRRLERLTASLGIRYSGKVLSFFEANESERITELMEQLRSGHDVLLVTDAGMPGVSDPGFRLVRAAISENIEINVLPGPSAVLTALVLSGCPVDRFAFDGFVPRTSGARTRFLQRLLEEERTVVLFEAPHRLSETMIEAVAVLGATRFGAICRELTKVHQEIVRGSLIELSHWASSNEILGEITLVISGAVLNEDVTDEQLIVAVQELEAAGVSRKEAISDVAKAKSVPKRRVFDLMVAFKRDR